MNDHIVKESTGDMRETGMLTGNDPGAVLRIDDDYLKRLKARDEHLAQWAAGEIERLRMLAKDAYDAWQHDMDMRVGKLLIAMMDTKFSATYRPDLGHNA